MIRVFNVYYPTRTVVLLLTEAVLIASCFLLAVVAIVGPDSYIVLNYEYGAAKIAVLTMVTLTCSYYCDLYEPHLLSDRHEIYFRIFLVLGFVSLLLSAVLYIYPPLGFAHNVLPLSFGLLAVTLVLWRRFYEWALGKKMFRESVYVLGNGEYAASIRAMIASRPDLGMDLCSWTEPTEADLDANNPSKRKKHPAAEAMRRFNMPRTGIDRVIVATSHEREDFPLSSMLALRFHGVAIEEANSLVERIDGKIHLDTLRMGSLLYSKGFHVRPAQQISRRVISFTVAVIGLLLFLPFFPFVVLAMRISSPGPLFFKQTRVGFGGQPFTVYKFRSMRIDAEAGGARWAVKDDPRVTKFGMFMRKTRIDEIPQLWNVLRGDMSFVGPRPERPEFVPMLSEQLPFYDLRHMIRPGLTGWAQVRFRYGATLEDTREKLQFDLYYIKHMSLGLDLSIMFETIKTIVRRRGAQ